MATYVLTINGIDYPVEANCQTEAEEKMNHLMGSGKYVWRILGK